MPLQLSILIRRVPAGLSARLKVNGFIVDAFVYSVLLVLDRDQGVASNIVANDILRGNLCFHSTLQYFNRNYYTTLL